VLVAHLRRNQRHLSGLVVVGKPIELTAYANPLSDGLPCGLTDVENRSVRSGRRAPRTRPLKGKRRPAGLPLGVPHVDLLDERNPMPLSVTEAGARVPFSTLMVDRVPDSKIYIDAAQCLPLVTYEAAGGSPGASLFDTPRICSLTSGPFGPGSPGD
jgi:hypothetical protein